MNNSEVGATRRADVGFCVQEQYDDNDLVCWGIVYNTIFFSQGL